MAKPNTKTTVVDYLDKSQEQDSSYTTNNNNTNSGETTTLSKNATYTTNGNNTVTKPSGVDDALWDKMSSSPALSALQTTAQTKAETNLSNLESVASNKNIISNSVWNSVNSQFVVPSAVREADTYLKSQLKKIQSGKTSYTDQVRDMMSQIQNREKFSYDVDTDPLFQQALASAMSSGKQAMQDTIGQASALTGGYGSTYATSAANQSYNAFIEDAYNNLPQYYQMAMEAYQMEGDEMYRQLGMLNDADDKEYNRNITAYDATYQHRNQLYNDAYTLFRDNKSDAFALGNLQLSENAQLVNNAYNLYNATSDYANTLYDREYNNWLDSVNQAMQLGSMLNSDYWSKANFDEGVRQYEQSFAEEQRQFNEKHDLDKRMFTEDTRRYDQDYEQKEKWNLKDDEYRYAALAQDDKQHSAEMNYKYSALKQDQNQFDAKMKYDKEQSETESLKSPTSTQISGGKAAYKNGGIKGFEAFAEELGNDVNISELIAQVASDSDLGMYFTTFKKEKDSFWSIPGGIDNNDDATDGNGTPYKVNDLPKDLQELMSSAPVGTVFEYDADNHKWVKKSSGARGGGTR